MTATVSVVVPVFERASVLPAAVQSILAQSVSDIEVLIVDDGSSVDLRAELGSFCDARVRWLRHPTNLGVAAARNSGVREAQAPYVAFLDSDDRWKPDKLERQLEAMNDPGSGIQGSCTGFSLFRPGREEPEVSREVNHADWFFHLMWGCNLSLGSTLMVERSSFDQFGYFDERFRRFEDWDWALRFVQRRRLILVTDTLCDIHISGPASPADVEAGLDLMCEKHLAAALARGFSAGRRFRSSLLLERAALAYRSGDHRLAVTRLLRAYTMFPFRNLAFYRQMLRHLVRTVVSS